MLDSDSYLGGEVWLPDSAQQEVLDRRQPAKPKIREIILANRQQLYMPGEIGDIRRGNYVVEGGFLLQQPFHKEFAEYENFFVNDLRKNRCMYARGLEQCISLDLAGLPAVVVDKHNFVLGFILEAYLSGLISKGSKIITFDNHVDIYERDPINLQVFNNLSEREKLMAILDKTSIGNWLSSELKQEGILDGKHTYAAS
ncbi:MAG: UPF0489 family protein, partial [Candidatus Gracilibacteria bacterium]